MRSGRWSKFSLCFFSYGGAAGPNNVLAAKAANHDIKGRSIFKMLKRNDFSSLSEFFPIFFVFSPDFIRIIFVVFCSEFFPHFFRFFS